MRFKAVTRAAEPPESPLRLFDELPRMAGAVPELWRQQGDVLREYARSYVDVPDVAIELPTGTGKTIVGLLVGDWRRRRGEQVVYACPTRQLAHQVAAVAKRESIPAVTLVGSSKSWSPLDRSRYDSAEALAVVTYNTIFNSSPKVGQPATMLFDDAHAGEQYVADAWSVTVDRFDHAAAWVAVVEALQPAMDGMFLQRILDPKSPDPNLRRDVRLIVPSRRQGMVEKLDAALRELPENSDQVFRRAMVRGGLASCLVYVGWREVLIRPFIPPTSENDPFSLAAQRIYLSATLGQGGELERAFGRQEVKRLPLPADAQHPRSGRRFFIFNDLVAGDNAGLPRIVVTIAGKALVLAPSHDAAQAVAADCNPGGWPVLTKDHVATGVGPFADTTNAILALAGRYDGIDLPGDACRLVILDGLPDAAHLQERFLASRVRATTALEERIRTRVVQGAGRCTRGPSDHAVVLLRGSELARYLSNGQRRATLDPDLQAEVQFGLENSRGIDDSDLADAARIFFDQGEEWRTQAEPLLVEARRQARQQEPAGAAQLAAAAPHEVASCQAAWRNDFATAAEAAQQAVRALSGNDAVRAYRGFWTYLAAVWAFAAGRTDPRWIMTGKGLLEQAIKASLGTTWLMETDPGDQAVDAGADDMPAVKAIAERISRGLQRSKIEQQLQRALDGLATTEATKVEPALTDLGALLGAEASKPPGQAQCDSAWCWDERVWLALEAKTEHSPDGEVSVRDVRQAGSQLRSLSARRGVEIPETSASIMISPRAAIDPDAVAAAEPHVHLTQPDQLRQLFDDVAAAWEDLLVQHPGHVDAGLQQLVRRVLGDHRILPTQVFERLTPLRVAG